jgi:microcystin-dependent protein
MAEPFIGEIKMFAGNFAPVGYALCNGQLQNIAQNTALFSLLGTTYGGDGETTFALPDLRARIPVHQGTGPGLPARAIGSRSGQETVTLNATHLPSHTHDLYAVSTHEANSTSPVNTVPARTTTEDAYASDTDTVNGNASSVGGQPHNNMPPYLGIHFVIALIGLFPS